MSTESIFRHNSDNSITLNWEFTIPNDGMPNANGDIIPQDVLIEALKKGELMFAPSSWGMSAIVKNPDNKCSDLYQEFHKHQL